MGTTRDTIATMVGRRRPDLRELLREFPSVGEAGEVDMRVASQRRALRVLASLVGPELTHRVEREQSHAARRQPGELEIALHGRQTVTPLDAGELLRAERPLIEALAEAIAGDELVAAVADDLSRASGAGDDALLDAHELALLRCADALDER